MYAFLTDKDYEIWELQNQLKAMVPGVKAITYAKSSTPYVVYIHTEGDLTQSEIDMIKDVL